MLLKKIHSTSKAKFTEALAQTENMSLCIT